MDPQLAQTSSFRSRAFRLMLRVAVFWYVVAFGKTLYDYFLLKNNSGEVFDFMNWLIGVWVACTIGLILLGPFIIFLLYRTLRAAPYWKVLIYLLGGFTLIAVGANFIAMPVIYALDNSAPLYGAEGFEYAIGYLQTPNYWAVYSFWLFVTIITVIVILVNEKYGPGMFGKLLLGQYYRPKREERIFMFLDMKSSTTIAETIGEEAYFNLLKDCFADMTGPILDNAGEIYQYVGDEIIVCWPLEKGMDQGRCVRTFFGIKQRLYKRAPYYLAHYGLEPSFKAGFHFGQVMAGEIGVIKRDITYSGDVLNTAARIQAKCNDLGVDHLISGPLWKRIEKHFPDGGEQVSDQVELRGRQERLDLYRAL
ncbi:MAG: adenylate/guanylate cyclase domain-containing protein [Bacteroidota bacterium]